MGSILSPADPIRSQPPYFDSESGSWVLTRYDDVLTALHEPRLHPEGEATPKEIRERTRAALSPARLTDWQTHIGTKAESLAAGLAADRTVDVVGEFGRPWALDAAVYITGVQPVDHARLESLSRKVAAAAAEPIDDGLRSQATVASDELERSFQWGDFPMAVPAFVALSQTLVCLLANAWLVLLRHPQEAERLRERQDLMPGAIDELLRFAPLAGTVPRRAEAQVEVAGVVVPAGGRVVLRLDSANRDPSRLEDPERFDIDRGGTGHLTLGSGPRSCAGAPLLRMAMAAVTGPFCRHFSRRAEDPVWRGGSGYRWPEPLRIIPARASGDRSRATR